MKAEMSKSDFTFWKVSRISFTSCY